MPGAASTPPQPTRTRGVAVVAVLAAASLLAGPAFAAPAPDGRLSADTAPRTLYQGDLSTVGLVAGGVSFQIDDDGIYFQDESNYPRLTRRALSTSPAGTYVGPVTEVGIMAGRTDFHAHDGAVAYARWNDKRLVITDATGATTVPTWAANDQFIYGVRDLDDSWIAGSGVSVVGVYNRQTGVRVPLESLTPAPSGYSATVSEVAVSETRVVWSVFGGTSSTAFSGLYTVALDPTDADGAVGSVTQLATATHARSSGAETTYEVLDTDSAPISWVRYEFAGDSLASHTLTWVRGAPYTGTPAERVLGDTENVVGLDGTVVTLERVEPSWSAEWYDLSGTATTPLRSLDLWGRAEAASSRFIAWDLPQDGATMLSDVTGGAVSVESVPTQLFSDVRPGDPFYAAIFRLNERGITGGYPDGTFRPLGSVNRGAMAAFLYRIRHVGESAPRCSEAPFADVPVSHPFCGEIAWLASTGITKGYPDGTFRPGQAVTREAMAAFLFRYLHEQGTEPACESAPFTDVAISNPFCGAIAWISRPASLIVPLRGLWVLLMARRVVLLPAPFEPMSVTTSPWLTCSVRPCRAWMFP